MIKLEEIRRKPTFSNQLENKILYSNHSDDISISYQSTYTLKYVIEGSKNYHYHNQDIEVLGRQYLILNNGSKITTEAKKGTKGLSFFLSPSLINEIYHYHTNEQSSLEFFEITQKQSNTKVHHLLDNIAYLYQQEPMVFKQQMEDLFMQVSELIVQEQAGLEANFSKLKIVKHRTRKELYQLVMNAREYLNDNLAEEISLDILSRDIGISKYYLHRLFTEIYGDTPLAHLTRIRIAKAKHQLQYSKASISEIAMACGFDNSSYFSNTFKKYTQLSPTQFRKNL